MLEYPINDPGPQESVSWWVIFFECLTLFWCGLGIGCLLGAPPVFDGLDEPAYQVYDRDPRTIHYNEEILPEVIPDGAKAVNKGTAAVWQLDYNIADKLDKTGSANNEHPWRHTGGLDDCGPEVTVERYIWFPENAAVEVWIEPRRPKARAGIDKPEMHNYVHGRFPEGTFVYEKMYESGRLFEVRSRKKVGPDVWETEQHEYGDKPAGYVAVNNCIDCHEDIGKHSDDIDPERDWYGQIRGLEPGGPIHWHPWEWPVSRKSGKMPRKLAIRKEVQDFVKFVDRPKE